MTAAQGQPAVFEFTVEGTGEFPFDMLAHDACYPTTTEDAMAMLLALPRRWPRRGVMADSDEPRKVHRIRLASAAHRPAVDRWKSFGWSVNDVRERRT